MISEKMIKELQKIIKTEYGVDLSLTETTKIGNDLVESFDVLARIDFLSKRKKTICQKTNKCDIIEILT